MLRVFLRLRKAPVREVTDWRSEWADTYALRVLTGASPALERLRCCRHICVGLCLGLCWMWKRPLKALATCSVVVNLSLTGNIREKNVNTIMVDGLPKAAMAWSFNPFVLCSWMQDENNVIPCLKYGSAWRQAPALTSCLVTGLKSHDKAAQRFAFPALRFMGS